MPRRHRVVLNRGAGTASARTELYVARVNSWRWLTW
jgi:hypothetical protein